MVKTVGLAELVFGRGMMPKRPRIPTRPARVMAVAPARRPGGTGATASGRMTDQSRGEETTADRAVVVLLLSKRTGQASRRIGLGVWGSQDRDRGAVRGCRGVMLRGRCSTSNHLDEGVSRRQKKRIRRFGWPTPGTLLNHRKPSGDRGRDIGVPPPSDIDPHR